jgi:hypothetical protein
MMMGDCIDLEACERSKQAVFRTGLLVEVVLYGVLMVLFLRKRRR